MIEEIMPDVRHIKSRAARAEHNLQQILKASKPPQPYWWTCASNVGWSGVWSCVDDVEPLWVTCCTYYVLDWEEWLVIGAEHREDAQEEEPAAEPEAVYVHIKDPEERRKHNENERLRYECIRLSGEVEWMCVGSVSVSMDWCSAGHPHWLYGSTYYVRAVAQAVPPAAPPDECYVYIEDSASRAKHNRLMYDKAATLFGRVGYEWCAMYPPGTTICVNNQSPWFSDDQRRGWWPEYTYYVRPKRTTAEPAGTAVPQKGVTE